MSLPTYTITADGVSRTVSKRDPGGSPTKGIIWLHGGNGSGENFSQKCPGNSSRVDLFPWGLDLPAPASETGWMVPGEVALGQPLPPGVSSDEYDLKFINAVVLDAASRFPSVTEWHIAGFSSGAKMCWGTSGYNNDAAYTGIAAIKAVFYGSHGQPTTFDWSARSKTVIPSCLWYGTSEPDPPHDNVLTFADSLIDLVGGGYAGCTGNSGVDVLLKADCGGAGKDLRKTDYTGGSVAIRRIKRVGGAHQWTYSTGCKEAIDGAVGFFGGS